jgi:hypothetical protein
MFYENGKIKKINKYDNDSEIYYTSYARKEVYGQNILPQRINLYIEEPGNTSITQEGEFSYNDVINLRIKNDKLLKNIHFCLKWSINVISVSTNTQFEETDKPKRFYVYDKCFDTKATIFTAEDEIFIPLEYRQISTVNDRDYIKVAIIDEDCFNSICNIEDSEGKDIVSKDVIYDIKIPSTDY